MSGPAWKEDFPVSWVDDHYVTRREFTKSLGLVSCAACVANGALLATAGAAQPPPGGWPRVLVGRVSGVPVGGSFVFDYPAAGDRCILLRLEADRFAAFSQKCTHLGCPVLWQPGPRRLYCPCHEGFFDEEGRVLAGPPPRPLPRIGIEREGDDLWAIGIRS